MLERRILDAFEDFGKDFLKSCSQEELAASIPVTVRKNNLNHFSPSISNLNIFLALVYEPNLRI